MGNYAICENFKIEYNVARNTSYIMRENDFLRRTHTFFLFSEATMPRESTYRTGLIKRIQERLPGCEILPNDPARRQGICDILILYRKQWGMLEIKRSSSAPKRSNQPYYVDKFNDMSFAAFISPENELEVLDELERVLVGIG